MRSAQPVKGRAETDFAKKVIMDRLLLAWQQEPKLRLGQLLVCATGGRDIFYDEDEPLAALVETYVEKYRQKEVSS